MKRSIAALFLVCLVSPALAQKQALTVSSPDNKLSATAKERKVTVTDVGTRKTLLAFSGHKADITGLSFSPDGKLVGSVDSDGKVNILDSASGRLLISINSQKGATGLTFANKGKTIEVKAANKTRKYDVDTGKEQQ